MRLEYFCKAEKPQELSEHTKVTKNCCMWARQTEELSHGKPLLILAMLLTCKFLKLTLCNAYSVCLQLLSNFCHTCPAQWVTLYNCPFFMVTCSLIPRPLPHFISQLWILIFLHSCEIKSGSGLGMRIGDMVVNTSRAMQEPRNICACIVPGINHSHYIGNSQLRQRPLAQ